MARKGYSRVREGSVRWYFESGWGLEQTVRVVLCALANDSQSREVSILLENAHEDQTAVVHYTVGEHNYTATLDPVTGDYVQENLLTKVHRALTRHEPPPRALSNEAPHIDRSEIPEWMAFFHRDVVDQWQAANAPVPFKQEIKRDNPLYFAV